MTKLLAFVIALFALTFLGACSTIRNLAEKADAPERVASALDRYCDEVPAVERAKNRESINNIAEKAKAGIWCPGDPPLTLGQ